MTRQTLRVYINESMLILDNYEICIDTTNIYHIYKKSVLTQTYSDDGYKRVLVSIQGKKQTVSVARAMISTFIGPPPNPLFTVDHINKNKDDNCINNLIWKSKKDQVINRHMPSSNSGSRIVVYNGVERTVKEWAEELGVSVSTIKSWVYNKSEWSYKNYDNISGEIWKTIGDNTDVSSLGRVGKTNTSVRRVYDTCEICISNGYPVLNINKTKTYLHVLVFKAFFPSEYENKQIGTMVLHKNDNKLDCSIDNLYIGDGIDNTLDAHNNGKYDGKGKERLRCYCISIQNGIRHDFESLTDAVSWLKNNGYDKAAKSSISRCLNNKQLKKTYDHTWHKL